MRTEFIVNEHYEAIKYTRHRRRKNSKQARAGCARPTVGTAVGYPMSPSLHVVRNYERIYTMSRTLYRMRNAPQPVARASVCDSMCA